MKNINNISLRGNDSGNNTIISSGDYGSLFSAIKQTTDNVNTLTQTISGLSSTVTDLTSKVTDLTSTVTDLTTTVTDLTSTVNAHIESQEERNKKIDNFIDSQVEMNKKIDIFIDSQVEMNSYLKSNNEAMKKLLATKGIIIENEKES